jgi:two-component system CheB/CheR fusion protein
MFRQADTSSNRPHGGMGIGLALVRQLIGLHGGTVVVESAVGQGAKFTIELPTSDKTEQTGFAPHLEEAGVLSQMRVLIVDDSADTVEMLRQLFETDGALVATANGGAKALEIAAEQDFDVVLSDISMPGMDGFEFVKRLRKIERQKDVPVIALTGFGRAEDVDRARAEGFLSHVTKPIDMNSVLEILRKLPVSNSRAAAGHDR